jgi:hypothetical protein
MVDPDGSGIRQYDETKEKMKMADPIITPEQQVLKDFFANCLDCSTGGTMVIINMPSTDLAKIFYDSVAEYVKPLPRKNRQP